MLKLLKFVWHKRYFLLLAAAAIIGQCYLQLMLPEYMGTIQTLVTTNGTTKEILIQGGYMLLISVGVICLAVVQFYSASTISAYVGEKLRETMFSKVNSLSYTEYNNFGTATLITRTTNDIEQIKNFVLMAVRTLIMSPTMMIIAIIKTAMVQIDLLIVMCIALPLILIAMIILLYVASPLFKKVQEKIDNVTVVMRENLTGIRVIRAYDQEETESKKFAKANKDLTDVNIRVNRYMSIASPFVTVVFNLCFIAIYALGFYIINGVSGELASLITSVSNQIENISVVAQYSMQIMSSFVMFAMIFIMMPQAMASAKRVNEVLDIDSNKDEEGSLSFNEHYEQYKKLIDDLYDKEKKALEPLYKKYEKEYKAAFNYELIKFNFSQLSEEKARRSPLKNYISEYEKIHQKYHQERKKSRLKYKELVAQNTALQKNESIKEVAINKLSEAKEKGVIEFKNVSFTYPGSDKPCLENISFKTEPGTTTAIIGSTGSGKSTIINLIPKFYDATEGEILLDGINIKDLPSDVVREHLGFVPQTALLFKGTIRSNMQFGKKGATDEEINKALNVAQATHFVSKLPEGLDSFVSQNGKNFSGGQKQRLCIARALVKDAEIYIFDDSFSALDFKTDAKLRAALKDYTTGASVIVVAQRVSSILDADNIIVLNQGKVIGQGKHSELIQSCPVYQDIVKSQLDPDEIEKTIKLYRETSLQGGSL